MTRALLAFSVGLALTAGCKASAGGRCGSDGEARCDGTDKMLHCDKGRWQVVACRGPKGCGVDGRKVDCDESRARVGDACGGSEDAVSCSESRRHELVCRHGTWQVLRACRGPKACELAPGARLLDCDDSVAAEGDPCTGDDDLTCSVDKKSILKCQAGKFVRSETCQPGPCRAFGDVVDCSEPSLAP